MRRSSRLQQEPPATTTLPTPAPNHEDEVPVEPSGLPDLGLGVEIVPLPDMDVGFNADYLTSQEQAHEGYSSNEDFLERDESDMELERRRA